MLAGWSKVVGQNNVINYILKMSHGCPWGDSGEEEDDGDRETTAAASTKEENMPSLLSKRIMGIVLTHFC